MSAPDTVVTPPPTTASTATPEQAEYTLPSLEKGPQSFFDEKTGSFWVGLPIGKIDFLTCGALLDRCKLDVLVIYQQATLRQQQRLVKPDGIRGLIKKLIPGR